MIIREFKVDTGPLLTGAGILGLAVGFGAQSLVKDVISGFFILFEDQYGVGDSIRIGDMEGVVEHMCSDAVTLYTAICPGWPAFFCRQMCSVSFIYL